MEPSYHTPEDFAADETFVHYCFYSNMEDVVYWNNWLQAYPEKKETADRARELVWMMSVRVPDEQKKREWEKLGIGQDITGKTLKALPGKRWFRWWQAAAVLVVLVTGIGLWRGVSENGKTHESLVKTYETGAGMRREIVLSDGTRVWLNAQSRLDWHAGDGNGRMATLTGEAYFDVAPDPGQPFRIRAGNVLIRVLGTAFNVKAYPSDSTVETSLVRGSVEVRLLTDSARRFILKPDEKITLDERPVSALPVLSGGKSRRVNTARFLIASLSKDPLLDTGTVETAWMDDKLVFRAQAFRDLAAAMERKYGVRIHFRDSTVAGYRFTGIFSTETVGEALDALRMTSPHDPFTYSVEGQDIFIAAQKP